jgi:hypothetical protein
LVETATPEKEFREGSTRAGIALWESSGATEKSVLFIDHETASSDPIHVQVAFEEFRNSEESCREQNVVRVEPSEDISFASRKSLLNGICLATIWPAFPIRQAVRVPLDYRHRAIRTATVDDDVLKRRILLIENRANSPFEELRLVETRSDDRDCGPVFGFQKC